MDFLKGEHVAIVLFFIGLTGMIRSRRILKTIVCLGIMDVSAVLFYLTMFAQTTNVVPIGVEGENAADPLPQALMITAIVIGLAVTAVALVMFINIYHRYGTSNWETLQKMRMENL